MDDATAIERCLGGEPDAYRHLVTRYQAQALAHARVLLGNRADAEDAVQEALMAAYRALERFDRSRRFYPWLYVILRNRCLKRRARERREAEARSRLPELRRADGQEVPDSLPAALARLRPNDREILVLRHFEGLTYAELAERLSIPRGTVMSRLHHARRRLADALEEIER
jgi:RNA polymerase sigma-70 factor (ECF subfamily)